MTTHCTYVKEITELVEHNDFLRLSYKDITSKVLRIRVLAIQSYYIDWSYNQLFIHTPKTNYYLEGDIEALKRIIEFLDSIT